MNEFLNIAEEQFVQKVNFYKATNNTYSSVRL